MRTAKYDKRGNTQYIFYGPCKQHLLTTQHCERVHVMARILVNICDHALKKVVPSTNFTNAKHGKKEKLSIDHPDLNEKRKSLDKLIYYYIYKNNPIKRLNYINHINKYKRIKCMVELYTKENERLK